MHFAALCTRDATQLNGLFVLQRRIIYLNIFFINKQIRSRIKWFFLYGKVFKHYTNSDFESFIIAQNKNLWEFRFTEWAAGNTI